MLVNLQAPCVLYWPLRMYLPAWPSTLLSLRVPTSPPACSALHSVHSMPCHIRQAACCQLLNLPLMLQVPAVNSSWGGDYIRTFHNVDVNVAVMTPAGLMVPFVRDADSKGLSAISAEVRDLAAKVGCWVVWRGSVWRSRVVFVGAALGQARW